MAVDILRKLSFDESAAFYRMLSTIRRKGSRNNLRAAYVEDKKRLDRIGFSVPPHMIDFQTPIGWASKGIKVPASRIRPDGFTLPRPSTLLDEISATFEDNYLSAVERMAIESSLQHSVAFVFVTPGDTTLGEPDVIVAARTALEATAEVDARTNRVTLALEMVTPLKALLYVPGLTLRVESGRDGWMVTSEIPNASGLIPCIPYIWGWSLSRPFGRSRVTRPLMGYIDKGVRTMLRQEVTAEFFSAPQRALLGADEAHFTGPDGKRISPLDALMGGLWALPDVFDEDEQKLVRPDLKQLQQASMQPHSEMMRTIGLMVSSELSIPVGYLGIIHDNPSSADAILASESDMIAMVEHEVDLGYKIAHEKLARTVLAVKYGGVTDAMAAELRGLSAHFANAGTPTRAARADAALKYTTAFPNGDPEVAMEEYGLSKSQIERNLAYVKRAQAGQRLDALVAASKASPAPVFSAGG
ncbi:phage portal protein [Arthrobacter sp. PAMC25564]|uniref:phage portal protein n=1 Tax=Arthrobacter sp. PAMC25564 TaxID=2565366 RepID=UPI0010A26465|nr:phage portal protein [Arthrobacter sp. PAMC25564]QCB97127.1 phage portal protein [Arthrobacter sp. PAMC25564]